MCSAQFYYLFIYLLPHYNYCSCYYHSYFIWTPICLLDGIVTCALLCSFAFSIKTKRREWGASEERVNFYEECGAKLGSRQIKQYDKLYVNGFAGYTNIEVSLYPYGRVRVCVAVWRLYKIINDSWRVRTEREIVATCKHQFVWSFAIRLFVGRTKINNREKWPHAR